MAEPDQMTDAQWKDRLRRSSRALASWRHEARLPWADREMTRTIAETELAFLRYAVPLLPDELQQNVSDLIDDWDELRVELL